MENLAKFNQIYGLIHAGKTVRVKKDGSISEANLSRWQRIRRRIFGHFKSTHNKTIKAEIIKHVNALNINELEDEKKIAQLASNIVYLKNKLDKQGGDFADTLQIEINTALFDAAREGRADTVNSLIKNGAAVKAATKTGWTALMAAAAHGHADTVNTLIEKGAEVNAADKKGWTPLMLAAQKGYANIVNTLIKNGANVNTANTKGRAALRHAAARGYVDIVDILIKNGAEVSAADKKGWTALMLAAQQGHADIVNSLITNGAAVKATTKSRWTALMAAAYKGHPNIVNILIENGAQVNATDRLGLTALMDASQEGHIDAVKILLENGANPNLANNRGKTALSLAQSRGHEAVAHLLDKEMKTNWLTYQATKQKNLGLTSNQRHTYLRSLAKFQRSSNQGYSTFHHAQTTAWMIASDLIKALQRAKHPEKDFSKFHFFRDPKIFNKDRDPQFFIKHVKHQKGHDDWRYRKHLLSVDVNPLNNDGDGESALHFFRKGSNVNNNAQQVALGIVNSHFGNSSSKNKARKLVSTLFARYGRSKKSCFYVIGVPEDKMDAIGYAAHPYGVACKHASYNHPGWIGLENKKAILKLMQEGKFTYKCDKFHLQYRLLTHRLTKENGIRTFRTSALSKKERRDIKTRVRAIAQLLVKN